LGYIRHIKFKEEVMKKVMKKMFLIATIVLALMGLAYGAAVPTNPTLTISWSLPTTYTDGSTIAAADIANITTNWYMLTGASPGTWTVFATIPSGGTTWTGTVAVTRGVAYQYTADVTLYGATSARMAPFSSTAPYLSPSPITVAPAFVWK
jgi:hypothetical protein